MKIWKLCLALYLLIVALLMLTNLEIVMVNVIQAVAAGAAAVLLLFDK